MGEDEAEEDDDNYARGNYFKGMMSLLPLTLVRAISRLIKVESREIEMGEASCGCFSFSG
jgi:hypothetical protein